MKTKLLTIIFFIGMVNIVHASNHQLLSIGKITIEFTDSTILIKGDSVLVSSGDDITVITPPGSVTIDSRDPHLIIYGTLGVILTESGEVISFDYDSIHFPNTNNLKRIEKIRHLIIRYANGHIPWVSLPKQKQTK